MLLLVALVATACKTKPKPLVTGERLDLGLANDIEPSLAFRTWDNEVAFTIYRSEGPRIGSTAEEIPYVLTDGTQSSFTLERLFPCEDVVSYQGFNQMPDRRITMTGSCQKFGYNQISVYLLAYDHTQQSTTLLLPTALTIDETFSATWNPSVTRGMAYFGSLFQGVYWVDASGAYPVTATIEANGKSISLSKAFLEFDSQNRANFATGNVTSPDWSPDGSTIAFFASTDSINRRGIGRITGSWLLCLMDTQTLEPKVVLKDIFQVGRPRWSSDGRFIAFNGQVGASGPNGLWLYSVANDDLQLVAEGLFSDFIWAADDTALYGIRYADDTLQETEVWQYDLLSILPTPAP